VCWGGHVPHLHGPITRGAYQNVFVLFAPAAVVQTVRGFEPSDLNKLATRRLVQNVLLAVADDTEILGGRDRQPPLEKRREREGVPVELCFETHGARRDVPRTNPTETRPVPNRARDDTGGNAEHTADETQGVFANLTNEADLSV
jgi:hypothetical protein